MFASLLIPLFFFPAYHLPFGGAKTVVFYVLVEITFPFFLCLFLSHVDRKLWFRHPTILLLGSFLLVMFLSAFLGEDLLNSLFGNGQRLTGVWFTFHLVLYSFYLMLFFAMYPARKQRFIQGVIWVATICAAYGVLEGWGWLPSATASARATSVFGNPIYFASYLVIPFFLSLWQFGVSAGRKKIAFLGAAFVLFGAVIATGTRGALLGIICGLLLFALFRFMEHPLERKKIALSVGGLLLLGLLLFVGISTTAKSFSIAERLTTFADDNVTTRLTYWGIALRGFVDYPLLGTGPENYFVVSDPAFVSEKYHVVEGLWSDKPHNYLLEMLVTNGVIGFGVFIALLVVVVKVLWKEEDRLLSRMMIAGLAAYLVQSLFIFETISASLMFILLIALPVSVRLRQSPEQSLRMSLGVSGAAILSLLALLFIVWPIHVYLSTMGSFTGSLDGLKTLDRLAEQSFVLDWRLIGREYREVFYREIEPLIQTGEWEQVVMNGTEAYAQAVELHPLRAQYWYEYAQLLSIKASVTGDQEGYMDSIEAIEQSAALAPERLDIALAQIQLYATVHEYEKAQALYEKTSQREGCWIGSGAEGVLEIQCEN